MHKARPVHGLRIHPHTRRKRTARLTVDERSFQNPKLAGAFLIAYKTFADLASKGSLFVITILAARMLSPQAFGVFIAAQLKKWTDVAQAANIRVD